MLPRQMRYQAALLPVRRFTSGFAGSGQRALLLRRLPRRLVGALVGRTRWKVPALPLASLYSVSDEATHVAGEELDRMSIDPVALVPRRAAQSLTAAVRPRIIQCRRADPCEVDGIVFAAADDVV